MRKIFFIPIFIVVLLLGIFVFGNLTEAQTSITFTNPLSYTSLEALMGGIIDFIFTVALVVAPLMIIIAGIFFVTAAGNPAQVEKAKGIILYTLIGFLITLFAKGFIAFLRQYLGI